MDFNFHFLVCKTFSYSSFRGITCGVLPYRPPVPRTDTRGRAQPHVTASLRSASRRANILHPYGVWHPNRHFLKYGAIPKSHAALRFLPLRNCVVSSVKKRELFEATRNGMQCCKFSRFSKKRPILGTPRAVAKRISFRLFSLGASKENRQIKPKVKYTI